MVITGDIHGELEIGRLKYLNKEKIDYVLIAGDYGILWKNIPDATEKYWLNWQNKKSWITLFVDGNHENYFRLDNLPQVQMFGASVGKVTDSIYHLKRGNVYTIGNKKFWIFGGAKSTDKQYRIVDLSWWEREIPSYEEENYGIKNLELHNWNVDYIITHTAPQDVIDFLDKKYCKFSQTDPYSLTKYLDYIKNNTYFKKWFIGHFHLDEYLNDKIRLIYKEFERIDI